MPSGSPLIVAVEGVKFTDKEPSHKFWQGLMEDVAFQGEVAVISNSEKLPVIPEGAKFRITATYTFEVL